MNKRYIGILIIILGLVIIAAIVYFLFFFNFKAGEEKDEGLNINMQNLTGTDNLKQDENKTVVDVKEEPQPAVIRDTTKDDLIRIAASVAERYGSYSNQSNYGNIKDLKIFMSSKMQAVVDNYIKEQQNKNIDNSIYYGVTTKAITEEITKFDNEVGRAAVLVKTKKIEATGATSNITSSYEDVVIYFIKERNVWKVDNIEWQ